MNKRAISIPGAPAPIGPYSQAVMINDTLYVSGQIPIDPKTGILNDENIELATKQVMDNILSLLSAVDMNSANIVKCSIFLKDLDNFSKVNDVYSSYFKGTVPPARETVQVSKLPMDVDVEISCIAVGK